MRVSKILGPYVLLVILALAASAIDDDELTTDATTTDGTPKGVKILQRAYERVLLPVGNYVRDIFELSSDSSTTPAPEEIKEKEKIHFFGHLDNAMTDFKNGTPIGYVYRVILVLIIIVIVVCLFCFCCCCCRCFQCCPSLDCCFRCCRSDRNRSRSQRSHHSQRTYTADDTRTV